MTNEEQQRLNEWCDNDILERDLNVTIIGFSAEPITKTPDGFILVDRFWTDTETGEILVSYYQMK